MKNNPEIDQELVEYIEGDRATLRGHAPVTEIVPEDVVRKVRGSLPYIPHKYFTEVQIEYRLNDHEQDFIDSCAKRWNISFERAYTRIMRAALENFRRSYDFAMTMTHEEQ